LSQTHRHFLLLLWPLFDIDNDGGGDAGQSSLPSLLIPVSTPNLVVGVVLIGIPIVIITTSIITIFERQLILLLLHYYCYYRTAANRDLQFHHHLNVYNQYQQQRNCISNIIVFFTISQSPTLLVPNTDPLLSH
jgi:hypothetical protein